MVQPSYGQGTVVLRWTTTQEFKDWGALVYRSPDGVTSWELLNKDAEPVFTSEFLDAAMPWQPRLDRVHYRVNLESPDGKNTIDGPPVGFFEQLSRTDFDTAARMIRGELKRISRKAGVAMFHCVPLTHGVRNPYYDSVTWLNSSYECQNAKEKSYGLPFVGGYGPPVQTWVQLLNSHTERAQDDDLTGRSDVAVFSARVLSFPQPSLGHMFVHPATDDRYLVGEKVEPFSYRGLVPIAFNVELTLMRRADQRYGLPVPMIDRRLTIPDFK